MFKNLMLSLTICFVFVFDAFFVYWYRTSLEGMTEIGNIYKTVYEETKILSTENSTEAIKKTAIDYDTTPSIIKEIIRWNIQFCSNIWMKDHPECVDPMWPIWWWYEKVQCENLSVEFYRNCMLAVQSTVKNNMFLIDQMTNVEQEFIGEDIYQNWTLEDSSFDLFLDVNTIAKMLFETDIEIPTWFKVKMGFDYSKKDRKMVAAILDPLMPSELSILKYTTVKPPQLNMPLLSKNMKVISKSLWENCQYEEGQSQDQDPSKEKDNTKSKQNDKEKNKIEDKKNQKKVTQLKFANGTIIAASEVDKIQKGGSKLSTYMYKANNKSSKEKESEKGGAWTQNGQKGGQTGGWGAKIWKSILEEIYKVNSKNWYYKYAGTPGKYDPLVVTKWGPVTDVLNSEWIKNWINSAWWWKYSCMTDPEQQLVSCTQKILAWKWSPWPIPSWWDKTVRSLEWSLNHINWTLNNMKYDFTARHEQFDEFMEITFKAVRFPDILDVNIILIKKMVMQQNSDYTVEKREEKNVKNFKDDYKAYEIVYSYDMTDRNEKNKYNFDWQNSVSSSNNLSNPNIIGVETNNSNNQIRLYTDVLSKSWKWSADIIAERERFVTILERTTIDVYEVMDWLKQDSAIFKWISEN